MKFRGRVLAPGGLRPEQGGATLAYLAIRGNHWYVDADFAQEIEDMIEKRRERP